MQMLAAFPIRIQCALWLESDEEDEDLEEEEEYEKTILNQYSLNIRKIT